MNDRLLSFLGLCKRAGYLISGADTVVRTMRDGKARLVLTAKDFSDNSRKNVQNAAEQTNTPVRALSSSKEELSFALGKHCGVICVTDKGFADKILLMIDPPSDGETPSSKQGCRTDRRTDTSGNNKEE